MTSDNRHCACGTKHQSSASIVLRQPGASKTAERSSDDPTVNFLSQFRDSETRKLQILKAAQFAETWEHYDKDGNGYIEGTELDDFLREFISSVIPQAIGREVVSETAFGEVRKDFMEAYDENEDGRIEIGELAQILPTDEEFLLLFRRNNPLKSSLEFIKIWKHYDKDRSGYIEAEELRDFLHDLLQTLKPDKSIADETVDRYTTIILDLFDRNKDGKLQLSEMARLLPVRENYLTRPLFKNSGRISGSDIDRLFKIYDEDNSGTMEEDELLALIKDWLELTREEYDENGMTHYMNIIMREWDVNSDGKISKKELKMLLLQQSKMGELETKPYHRIILKRNLRWPNNDAPVSAVSSDVTP